MAEDDQPDDVDLGSESERKTVPGRLESRESRIEIEYKVLR